MFIYYGYGSNLQASNVGLKSRYTPKWQYLYKAKQYMRFDHGHLGYPISDKPIMLMHHSAVWAKKSYFEFHLEVSTVSNEITSAVAQNPSLA
jgi:hypothetical protein